MSTSTDVLISAVSAIVMERDHARKALEAALSKIDMLEEEVGESRMTARLSSILEDFAPRTPPRIGAANHPTGAWTSSSESIKRVSANPVPKTFPTISNKLISPRRDTSPPKPDTWQPRCSRCSHLGHVDSECRFHFQCSKCKLFGHTIENCRTLLHIHCAYCNAYGHTEDRCFSKRNSN